MGGAGIHPGHSRAVASSRPVAGWGGCTAGARSQCGGKRRGPQVEMPHVSSALRTACDDGCRGWALEQRATTVHTILAPLPQLRPAGEGCLREGGCEKERGHPECRVAPALGVGRAQYGKGSQCPSSRQGMSSQREEGAASPPAFPPCPLCCCGCSLGPAGGTSAGPATGGEVHTPSLQGEEHGEHSRWVKRKRKASRQALSVQQL